MLVNGVSRDAAPRSRVLPPPEPPSRGPRLHLSRRSLRCREDDRALGSAEVGGKDAQGGFNHGQVIMEAKIATGHSEVEVQLFLM